MAKYRVEVTRAAEKQLSGIAQLDQVKILKRVVLLADNPWPEGCRKLSGYDDTFRIRIGVYRVIYTVEERIITVAVLKIGHRKDIYR